MSKKCYLIVFLLAYSFQIHAQVFHKMYLKYKDYHTLLESHQTGYYQDNIFPALGVGENIHPLAFDAYGSLYPDFEVLKYVSERGLSLGKPSHFKKFQFSLFQTFQDPRNYNNLKKGTNEIVDSRRRDFYLYMLDKYSYFLRTKEEIKEEKTKNKVTHGFPETIQAFYKEWDLFHNLSPDLMSKIDKSDKVIFFITGFNNPYNFMTLQSLELNNQIKFHTNESVLLIPVLWTAQADKKVKKRFGEFKDKNGFFIKPMKLFWHHFNQAYLTAASLRRVLNQIENEATTKPEVSIISHSSGTTIASSIFINSTSKLKHNNKKADYYNETLADEIINQTCSETVPSIYIPDNLKDIYSIDYPVNHEIFRRYESNPIPKGKYKVFMSAASMPGYTTFKDLCEDKKQDLYFFNTINTRDKDLKKKVGIVRRLSSTELGLNYDCDAFRTKIDLFSNSGFFKNSKDINQKKHSLFCYMNHPNYREILAEFLKMDITEAEK